MNQDQMLQEILKAVKTNTEILTRHSKDLEDLKQFAAEQRNINEEQKKFNEHQLETNENLEFSHKGMIKLIEEEVVNRLDARDEGAMVYTDRAIAEHERKYRHVPVPA
jgi:hypothetical protein